MFCQLFLCFGFPRCSPGQEFIKYYPNGPYVTFKRVLVVVEGLWGHVDGRPNVVGGKLFPLRLPHREPKVPYFDLSVLQKYICRLQIPMDDTLHVDINVPIHDLLQEFDCFGFGESPFSGNHVGEITPITKFAYDVGIIFCRINMIKLDDMIASFKTLQGL